MELVTLRVLFPMVEVTLRSPGRRAELRGKHEIRRKKKKKKGCHQMSQRVYASAKGARMNCFHGLMRS